MSIGSKIWSFPPAILLINQPGQSSSLGSKREHERSRRVRQIRSVFDIIYQEKETMNFPFDLMAFRKERKTRALSQKIPTETGGGKPDSG